MLIVKWKCSELIEKVKSKVEICEKWGSSKKLIVNRKFYNYW